MRKAILITSVIAPELDVALNFGNQRSVFTPQERCFQTALTLHSLRLQQPTAELFLCDASVASYQEALNAVCPSLNYLHLDQDQPELAAAVRQTTNKSLGECQLLLALWQQYKNRILSADFLLKVSGRYCFENLHDNFFTTANLDKYLFPYHETDERDWVDEYGLDWSLARSVYNPLERRRVLRTVLYGMGRYQFGRYFEAIRQIQEKLQQPAYWHYDIENLLPCELGDELGSGKLCAVDWHYLGWSGVTQEFVKL